MSTSISIALAPADPGHLARQARQHLPADDRDAIETALRAWRAAWGGGSGGPPMSSPLTVGEVCAGYGGIGMGLAMLVPTRLAWVADIESGPTRLLAHHWPHVPNHGGITCIDWERVEPVDVLCGGTPCQDLSQAGRRAGMRPGTRSGLWESMAQAIEIIRPRAVIWENVKGALSASASSSMEQPGRRVDGGAPRLRALGRVVGDLASLGYDAQWTTVRASDVGAPHQRARIFLLAHPADTGGIGLNRGWETREGRPEPADGSSGAIGLLPTLSCANNDSRQSEGYGLNLGSAIRDFGRYASAVARWETVIRRPAPEPSEPSRRAAGRRLSAAFAEWMMGLPEGWVTEVPGLSYSRQIRLLGNGVVPQQAAYALTVLSAWSRMEAPTDGDECGTPSLLDLLDQRAAR